MHVNELAKRANIPAHVVRHYTQVKLMKPKRDLRNRYRKYAETDVYRLRFIRRAKWFGFTLCDVKAILRYADRGVASCPELGKIIKERARENHDRLDELNCSQTGGYRRKPRRGLDGRLLLPVPRLEIRSGGPRDPERAGGQQSGGPAASEWIMRNSIAPGHQDGKPSW